MASIRSTVAQSKRDPAMLLARSELLAYAVAYNLVRLHMLDAARREGVPPDRISLIDAVDVLCHTAHNAANVTLFVHPARPGRDEPRVIKRPIDR